MNVEIPYGKEKILVNVPEPCKILTPKSVKIKNQHELIQSALSKPLGKESFDHFAHTSKKLLVIVNDATRPTPTSQILDYLYPTLSAHPDVTFLIATGVHRAPTEEEYHFIFGDHYDDFRHQIVAHDARKKEDMVYLGTSKNGTEMYINRLVPEIGNVLVIGSVEPHYFAGYTGGRKSFLPGVASYKTIEMNHKLALSDKACSLVLQGNPVNEDMVDAMKVLHKINIFSIQTVLTGDHRLYAVTAGDLHQSFNAAITYANQMFCVPLQERADIVVSAAPYPMDIDLYQSQKALDNGKLALKKGGILILVSKCRTGVGEESFLNLLCKASTHKEVLTLLGDEYKLGYHIGAKMAQIGIDSEMWAVTDLPDAVVQKALLKPYSTIQAALDEAVKRMKKKGKKPRTIVMPSGSLTIPLLQK